ncbi:MAG: bifunctional riboflavin kinase/FAD synthetase [Bacteriovorax sp.]|jgi:riboflavin kinase/FMN adenylyltransferase|nr:bifunctional riboflavin kinase/FAD synthetase [Bacteriovorax sp.]
MITIKNFEELKEVYSEEKVQVTIGNFDGVHVGHQEFLSHICKDCKKNKSKFVVITFVPHPVQILKAQSGFLINTFAERRELLDRCGVDYLLEVDFTRDFSTLSPETFLKQYVFSFTGIDKIYLGHDFAFGANKSGDYKLAKNLCENEHVELILQDEFRFNNHSVSSSVIRGEILKGAMEKVNQLLGRPYFLSGHVVKGQGRGRQIGFPTANMDYDKALMIPGGGVYITQTCIQGMVYNSVTNIGINPTFNMGQVVNVETHLFDFNRDIYGEEMRVSFLKKLRDEKKYSSVNDLISQIDIDVKLSKEFFKNA